MNYRILGPVLALVLFSGCAHMTAAQRKAYKEQKIARWVEKGDAAIETEEYIYAEYCYRQALRVDDYNPKAVNAMGQLFARTGKHLKEGERYAVRTLAKKNTPESEKPQLYNTLTLLYTKQKKKKKAIQTAGMAEWAQLSAPPRDNTAALP